MDKRLERILPRVQKPARYTGGEYNAVMKDKSQVDTRFAFCFPDTYEIGMSNLGFRILYGVLNQMSGVWCERVFTPWPDMEEELRRNHIPLYALESGDPVGEFDIIGFSVGYEMAYTAMLNMMDLSGLPLRAEDRPSLTPLVIAGGTAMYNAEPVADFIDLALIGEGEELRRWWSSTAGPRAKAGTSPGSSGQRRRYKGYMFPPFITFRIMRTAPSPPLPLWTARRRRCASGWSTIWTSPTTP